VYEILTNYMSHENPDRGTNNLEIGVFQTPLAEGLPLPERAYESDVGFDIRTAVDFRVGPGESVRVPTGLVFDLPTEPFEIDGKLCRVALVIEQRTGNGGRGLIPAATIVDPGYRPDPTDVNGLTLLLRNIGNKTLKFKRGDAVVQGLFQLFVIPTLTKVEADEVEWDTDRGAERFGETGR
jgi:dUTPase